ncbi:MAG: zinc ribbon domain-containing protein [Candidatus Aminicenantes bacterium]|nr:zinc ribbon domain-containing protein [Candidatus Aminicenantes bacterium]
MPIYEYRCGACGRKSTFVTLSVGAALDPRCQHCGSGEVRKLVSRVAILRSEAGRLEGLDDPSALSGLDESDPASMARWMKKMGREMGEEAGPEFEQEIDRAVEEAAEGKDGPGDAAMGDGGGDEDPGGPS